MKLADDDAAGVSQGPRRAQEAPTTMPQASAKEEERRQGR